MTDLPTFTMGTDPELVFLDAEGQLLQAAEYVPRHDHALRGLDPNEIGSDGHPWTGELRPPPGNPEELTEHIRRIMRENKHRFPNGTIWRAGAFVLGKSLGGHIHYGFPAQQNLVDALDGVLSQVLACAENPEEAKKRRAGQYGRLGDVRPQPHGFEYRTPSSFIVNPSITLGTLGLAKAIAVEELTKGPMSVTKLKGDRLKLVKVDTKRYMLGDRAHFVAQLPEIWSLLSQYRFWKTSEGKRLWRHVASLKQLAHYPGGWHNGHGLLERWRLVVPAKPAAAQQKIEVKLPQGAMVVGDAWEALNGGANPQLHPAPPVAPRRRRNQVELDLAAAEMQAALNRIARRI